MQISVIAVRKGATPPPSLKRSASYLQGRASLSLPDCAVLQFPSVLVCHVVNSPTSR